MMRTHTANGFRRASLSLVGLGTLVITGCAGQGTAPAAPSHVVASAGPSTITVGWRDNSDDEIGFALLRAAVGDFVEDFVEIATVPANIEGFVDSEVTSDAPYTYKVVAIGRGGRSQPSEPSVPVRAGVGGVTIVDPDDPIGVGLNRLGIDTTASDRLDANGDPLPATYYPLGTTVTLGLEPGTFARSELFIGGAATSSDGVISNQVIWEVSGSSSTEVEPVFGLEEKMFHVVGLEAAAAGDFDGDGLDEIVVVDMRGNDHAQLVVSLRDDSVAGFASSEYDVATVEGVITLGVIAGDWNGDGVDSLAVALGMIGRAELLILEYTSEGFAIDHTIVFEASVEDAETTLAMAAGNLDHDAADELAVVVNEAFVGSDGSESGVARYRIFDDATTGFALLAEGFVQGQDGPFHNALVADLAMGDIDGDGRAEVVFAGITHFHRTCDPYSLLFVALDDALAATPLGVLGVRREMVSMGDRCSTDKVKRLRFIHAEIADLDGDGRGEIIGGPLVFEDWSSPWEVIATMPDNQFWGHGVNDRSITITAGNSALAVLDMDGDGASEIVYFMRNAEAVNRYELPAVRGDVLTRLTRFRVHSTFTENGWSGRPMLVAANVDRNSMVVRAMGAAVGASSLVTTTLPSEAYRFTMTAPIIIAAIAAAPCNPNISQNIDACGASYGEGSLSGIDREQTVTISASVSIGMKAIGGALTQSELSAKGTIHAAASYTHGYSYNLEKSIVYATGPLEDAVLFTAIPYDQYTYVIVQHPDLDMIGQEVVVSLPREPVTVLVERSYFNDALEDPRYRIGSDVFHHTVGRPSTYLDVAQRDHLIGELSRRFQRAALLYGPVSVGQGKGSTEVRIDVSQEHAHGGALEVGFEYEVEAVGASVLTGFTVGVSGSASFSRSSGDSTSYSGRVGNIADGTEFAQHGYRYGMFTYVYQQDTGEQFEVIDFWVE